MEEREDNRLELFNANFGLYEFKNSKSPLISLPGNINVCYLVTTYPRNNKDLEVPWLRKIVNMLSDKINIMIFAPSYNGIKSHSIDKVFVYRYRYFIKNFEFLTHDEGAPNKIKKNPLLKLLTIPFLISGILQFFILNIKKKFNIIHIHWPFPMGIIGIPIGKLFKKKIILNFHGASLLMAKEYPFVNKILRILIKHSDIIIANSTFTARKIKEIYNKKVYIIPFGSTIKISLKTTLKEEKRKSNKFKILFVGRLIERKGVKYLVLATKILIEKYKFTNIEVNIVGDGFEKENILQLIKEKNLENFIFLRGKVSSKSLSRYYTDADIFVLPAIIDSRGDTEGLGVVLIEALLNKKFVIASNIGGIPDIIKNNKTGFLVKEKNPEEIAKKIMFIVKNFNKIRHIPENGYKYVQKHFNWENIFNRLLSIYKNLI